PGVLVGGDVGRIKRAERQRKRETSGIVRAARRGVTDKAVGSLGEIFAPSNDIGLSEFGRNAGWIGFVVVGKLSRRAAGKRERPGGEDEPRDDADGDDDESGDSDNGDAAHGGQAFFMAMAVRSTGRRRRGTPVAA